MANRKKITKETIPVIANLLEMGLPVRIIAQAINMNPATIQKYLPILKKEDSEIVKGSQATQLRMLELYSSWVAQPHDFALITAGTEKDLLAILWKELRLNDFQNFAMGILAAMQITTDLTFDKDIPEQEQKFIKDIYFLNSPAPKLRKIEFAKGTIYSTMRKLHRGEIPFPTQQSFAKRMDCYIAWTEEFITAMKKDAAPFVDQSVRDAVKLQFRELPENKQALLEYCYELQWISIDRTSFDEVSQEVTRTRKWKSLKNLHSRLEKVIFNLSSMSQIIKTYHEQTEFAEQKLEEQRNISAQLDRKNQELKVLITELSPKLSKSIFDNSITDFSTINFEEILSDMRVQLLIKPIIDCDFSVRVYNGLCAAKVYFIFELIEFTTKDLSTFRNFGKKSVIEIEAMLHEKKLRLGAKLLDSEREIFNKICYPKKNI